MMYQIFFTSNHANCHCFLVINLLQDDKIAVSSIMCINFAISIGLCIIPFTLLSFEFLFFFWI